MTIAKPSGSAFWYATLYYQTTSKEYVEFLRDEINGNSATLSSPTPLGEPNAYIVQSDPFFANLKGWGNAIWDLWLYNGGAEPVVMGAIGAVAAPPCNTPDTPQNLKTKEGKRRITLSWNSVDGADGYHVYYSQNSKYTFIASTSEITYNDVKLISRQTYCYVVIHTKLATAQLLSQATVTKRVQQRNKTNNADRTQTVMRQVRISNEDAIGGPVILPIRVPAANMKVYGYVLVDLNHSFDDSVVLVMQ